MLCDIESSCAVNDMETEGIYYPSNQNHEAPYESLTFSRAQLSLSMITISHEDLCGLSHARFSCDSTPKFM